MCGEENQAKYLKLKKYIKDEILMGRIKPGDRIPSENELAQMMSVSRNTVRKAISTLVNEGYLYTEHGKGTFCRDRSITKKNSRNIGVITTYISEYIFPKVIQGIDNVLAQNGYSIILKNTDNDVNKEVVYLEELLDKDVEGLIIEPTKSALFSYNLNYYEALDRNNIPYVFIHGYYKQLEDRSQVLLDDAEGMYRAVNYLAEIGHRHIVGIFKADDIQGINRHRGYVRALAEHSLQYDPEYVIWFHTEDRQTKPASELKSMISAGMPVDAVSCYNDEVAFRIYELLKEMGKKVPEDISITGFDDSYLSVNCPVKLTTVSHPKEKLGEIAAQVLIDMIHNNDYKSNPVKKIIKPELIIRDSCIRRYA